MTADVGSAAAAAADPVSTAPAIAGPHGRAWAIDLEAAAASRGIRREDATTVCALVIEAPWAHPLWHSYILSVGSLRPMPNLPPAVLHLPGATHEIVVAALCPKHPRQATIGGGPVNALVPLNFAAQYIEPNDAAAMARAEAAARAVCLGQLSPDTDARQQWMALFGGNMVLTGAGLA